MRVPGLVVCATVAALAAGAAMAQALGSSPAPDGRAVRVPPAAGVPLEPCPEDMGARRGAAEPFACTCTAQAADTGTAFGTDVYAGASSVCRSALHAGVIGPGGGAVTVIPEPGRTTYPGVTRNGVPSVNFGAWKPASGSSRGPAKRVAPPPPRWRRARTIS